MDAFAFAATCSHPFLHWKVALSFLWQVAHVENSHTRKNNADWQD
jgi:hypothetical protein